MLGGKVIELMLVRNTEMQREMEKVGRRERVVISDNAIEFALYEDRASKLRPNPRLQFNLHLQIPSQILPSSITPSLSSSPVPALPSPFSIHARCASDNP